MTTKKWILVFLCILAVSSCNNGIDREKLSEALRRYDDFINFSEGLAKVHKDNKWGFIDKTGKEIIPCIFENIQEFSDGLARVSKDEKWGFIDKTGTEVIPCIYTGTGEFSEGLAARRSKDGKWGFIDKTGKEIIPCIFENIQGFSDGLARVSKDEKWGFIDKTGKEVIPCIYTGAGEFSDGLAARRCKDGKWGFIDKTGKEIIPCIFEYVQGFSDGLARVIKDKKHGFIDKTGKEVIPCIYTGAGEFSERLARVIKDKKCGFIDKTGKEVIPCIFEYVGNFSEGLAKVCKDDKWGFIDKDGYFIGQGIVEKVLIINKKHETENIKKESARESNSQKKNNLVTIRLEATTNKGANSGGVSNIKCNYGDEDRRILSGYTIQTNYGDNYFSSGKIIVPSGKSWIYKDYNIIEEASNYYKPRALISKGGGLNGIIRIDVPKFTGITLHEGNIFRVFCSAVDRLGIFGRHIPDGSTVGVEFTFIEIEY
jgi:hypothetical protein